MPVPRAYIKSFVLESGFVLLFQTMPVTVAFVIILTVLSILSKPMNIATAFVIVFASGPPCFTLAPSSAAFANRVVQNAHG
jgi:hypothetical protein